MATLHISAQTSTNLVQNGAFDTGDFTGWTTSGDVSGLLISVGFPHSGLRSLLFGSPNTLAFVSQNLPTTAGQNYLLSFWVWNDGDTPNQFVVQWGGVTLLNQQNLVAVDWTNIQFVVTATNASTPLKFGGWNGPGYTALDDVSVTPPGPVVTNVTPVLPAIGTQILNELTFLTVTNTAIESNPTAIVTYTLLNSPSGVGIDGNGVITWLPGETDGPGSYTITTKATSTYLLDQANPRLSATNSFNVTVNEVNVAPVLPDQPGQSVNELTLLTVTNTATDSDIPANALAYQLINPPSGVTINGSGIIRWTPTEAQGPGTYTITTAVTDNGNPVLGATNSFLVTVNEVNLAPVLPAQTNRSVNELTQLVANNSGSDPDLPANVLSYQLLNPPAGAVIDGTGAITWTPTEAQGPGNYVITTVVTDNGTPSLSATNSFNVKVNEVNSAPVLPAQVNRSVNKLSLLTVTNTATDSDLPANILSYQLIAGPAGSAIDSAGVITWIPSVAQGQGTYTITTVVTDNGTPPLSATNSFTVTVNDVNSVPVLPTQGNRAVNELVQLTVTNTATDSDIPANVLSYQLVNPPAGAAIDSAGVIRWTPTEAQGPGSYAIITVVTDNGTPPLSATNSFTVTVNEVNSPPILPPQSNRGVNELALLTVTNAASDSDIPANILSYQLIAGPAGSAIDSAGVITWIPSEAQGPGTYTLTTVVTDNGVPNLRVTNSFTVTVSEINSAPLLAAQANLSVNELVQLAVTNTALDSDIPANVLSYQLVNPPAGAGIDSAGVIRWTPTKAQGPGTYTITTVVTDNGTPPLSATNSFTVTVNEVNSAPVLPAQVSKTVNELVQLTVTNTAMDSDIPANVLSYQLINPPAGAAVDSAGVIRWTPTEAQGPGTYTLTTVVTDNGTPPLSATNSFTVTVNEVNNAPVLPAQVSKTVNELVQLTITNTATDSDIPANVVSYQLISPPAGATINASGVITWTPTEAQGPGTYTLTTVVTDNGTPPLSATNSFTVTVNEVNSAPVLAPIGNQTVRKMTLLTFTASAADGDIPGQELTFGLDPGAPTGAAIDPVTGVFTWTPTASQGPATNSLTIKVTDNGVPPLSDSETIVVVVTDSNSPPVLTPIGTKTVNEGSTLSFTAIATDPDLPSQTLTYSLDSGAPAGAVINPTTGQFSWTPGEQDGPGTNYVVIRVTDNGTPPASGSQTVTIVVNEVNRAPVLPAQTDRNINELTQLVVTNTASDPDIPANILAYQLVNPPAGAVIDSAGVIRWAPTEAQGPGSYAIMTVVTDNGTPPLSATNAFNVTVNNIVVARPLLSMPVLTSSTATLFWTAIPGKTYRVQYTSDLNTNNWLDLPGDIVASGGTASKDDTLSADHRFYRVELLP